LGTNISQCGSNETPCSLANSKKIKKEDITAKFDSVNDNVNYVIKEFTRGRSGGALVPKKYENVQYKF
jgi:hypothetical protein